MKTDLAAYMVKSPYVGSPDLSLRDSLEIMKDQDFRHLPIVEDDRLVGILSERDLREALALPQSVKLRAEDIMKTDVYAAKKTEPLKKVVEKMAELKCGSTVVVDSDNSVIGIFTTTDALRILADFLEQDDEEEEEDVSINYFLESWVPDSFL